MRAGDNFDKVTDSFKEYVRLKIEDIKLQSVESLSIIASDVLCALIVVLLSVIALLFVIFAIMILVTQFIGIFYGSLVVGGTVALIACVVYLFRKELFVNVFVGKLSKMFFNEVASDEKN